MVRNVNPRRFNVWDIIQDQERRLVQIEQQMFNRGRWTSYTPTLTNITLGNGSVDARWTRINDFVQVKILFTFGSTTSFTGVIEIGTPVGGTSFVGSIYPMGTAIARRSVSSGSNVFKGFVTNSATDPIDALRIVSANGTNGGAWDATTPFTWTTGDVFSVDATYEAVD